MKRLIPLILVVPLLAACGSTSASKAADCLTVPDAVSAAIAGGGKPSDLVVKSGAAVKSTERKDMYFVALKFTQGSDATESIGLWAAANLDEGANTFISVDGYAKQFTQWPDGSASSYKLSMTEKDAKSALECAGN